MTGQNQDPHEFYMDMQNEIASLKAELREAVGLFLELMQDPCSLPMATGLSIDTFLDKHADIVKELAALAKAEAVKEGT